MPAKNPDLHGFVPNRSKTAVLVIDVFNGFDFPGGDKLLKRALPAARSIARLLAAARAAKIPVIFTNDNFGRWKSDIRAVIDRCAQPDSRGHRIARLLVPGEEDYFVVKPKHSAFFSTTLDTLLAYLGAETLVLCGFASNLCVLFTANDAHMRDYELVVPYDCMAASTPAEDKYTRFHLEKILRARVAGSKSLIRRGRLTL